jgi:broad specificity phosphatase PhoE
MATEATPETRVILIRHGQTAWNAEQVFRGRADVPLDDVGRRQAAALAEALYGEPIAHIAASPLSRAVQTAEALAVARSLQPHPTPHLIDIDFGAWQGMPHGEVRQRFRDMYATWLSRPHEVTFPNGESLDAVAERSAAALAKLTTEYSGQTIAVVAHRVVNKVLLCHIIGLGNSHFWQIRQDTACINRFHVGGTAPGFVLDCLNDTCHLRHLDAATADF